MSPEDLPPAPPAGPTRRRLLVTAAGLALAAGTGTALWRAWRTPPEDAAQSAFDALLGRSLDRPDGRPLALAGLRGHPLVVNFWATWCPPCVREWPELDAFARQQAPQGWRVLGVAIDQAQAVQSFLAQRPVDFDVVLGGDDGLALTQALGNSEGGLPFTLVTGADGRIRHRKLGATTRSELQSWASRA